MHNFLSCRELNIRCLDGELHEILHTDFCGLGIAMNSAYSPFIRLIGLVFISSTAQIHWLGHQSPIASHEQSEEHFS